MVQNKKKHFLNSAAACWLLEAIRGKKRYIAAETLLQALVGLGTIFYSLLFRGMIDRAVEKNTPGFFRFLIALAVLAMIRIGLRAMIRWLDEHTCAIVENSLKARFFSQLLRREYSHVTAVHTAQWMNRLTSDTVIVANGVVQIIPNICGMAVKLVGAFLAMVYLQPLFALIVIPLGSFLIFLGYMIRPIMKRLHKNIQESDGRLRELLQERLENLLIVDAYSQQNQSVAMAGERMADHRSDRMRRNFMSNLNQVGVGIAMQGVYLLAAGYCAWGIMKGTISYGTMTALLQMIGYLQSPLSGMGGYMTQWYAMLSSAERLMEAELLPEDVIDQKANPETCALYYREEFQAIRLEELVFSYVERSSNQDLSVTIRYDNQTLRKGEFISLAGSSGCGKSTLLKLLLHVYKPESGKILLEGRDVKTLSSADRGLFAYVPQGNMLMSGTIRQIIAFYDEKAMAREEDMRLALRIACAEEFVDALPQKLDTLLGEHGTGLSEGQVQRIALARAIFSGRPILLLDEATSALDELTEAAVLDNLKTMTDKTVLIVTHRPRACEICDRVIYMGSREERIS